MATNDVAKRRTPGRAIASLILGIVGIVLIPVIPAIIAVVLGRRARAEIDGDPQLLEGRGLATAGIILGWIGIGLFAAGVLIGLAIGLG